MFLTMKSNTERWAEMPTSSIEFVVHPAYFHPYYLLLSHLHYIFWEKISDIIKGDRDNNEGVLH